MGAVEIVRQLFLWTPFLAGGFAWNVAISLFAMATGTAGGYLLASWRASPHTLLARVGGTVTELMRNVPTFVFQFYLVFMLPGVLALPGGAERVPFPSWLKASLALALAVAGFVSDNLLRALHAWHDRRRHEALLFVMNWGNFFVIVVMASSTASVIGVSELVSRCNTVINVEGKTDMMLWVYLYAMAWFFLFCYSATVLVRKLSQYVELRISKRA
jgi:polar amino acid transport system permease protein